MVVTDDLCRKDSPIIQCPTPPHSPTAGSSQLFPQENELAAGGSPKYGHDPQEGMSKYGHGPQDGMSKYGHDPQDGMSKYGHGPQDGMLGVKPRDRYPSSNNGLVTLILFILSILFNIIIRNTWYFFLDMIERTGLRGNNGP